LPRWSRRKTRKDHIKQHIFSARYTHKRKCSSIGVGSPNLGQCDSWRIDSARDPEVAVSILLATRLHHAHPEIFDTQ
jgi:hypothetical protein